MSPVVSTAMTFMPAIAATNTTIYGITLNKSAVGTSEGADNPSPMKVYIIRTTKAAGMTI